MTAITCLVAEAFKLAMLCLRLVLKKKSRTLLPQTKEVIKMDIFVFTGRYLERGALTLISTYPLDLPYIHCLLII